MLLDRLPAGDGLPYETKGATPRRVARPHRALWARLLHDVIMLSDGQGRLVRHAEREWASATFTGTRHTIELAFAGAAALAAAERLIAQLPDHEFALPGQIVADAQIVAVDHRMAPPPSMTVTCELLLLADC